MDKHNNARTKRDDAVPLSLLALRDRLAQAEASNILIVRKSGGAARFGWVAAAAGAIVAVTVAVALSLNGPPAAAATPEPLIFTKPPSVREVIAESEARLSALDGVEAPTRSVRLVSWGIVIEDGHLRGPVVPQFISLDWNEDLSADSLIVEGQTLPAADSDVGEVAPTEEIISEQLFEAGQFGVPSASPPRQDAGGVAELLTMFGMPTEPTPGEVVQATVSAMGLWTLSDEQHSALLHMLLEGGDVESLGYSTDRLNRPVLGLRVESAVEGMTDVVLISTDTGRIVGVESLRVEADGTVPAGTVVSYQLWTDEERNLR